MFQHHAPLAINIDGSMWQLNWMAQMLKNCNPQSYAINKERMTRVAEYSRDCLRELRKETGIHYENRAKGTLQVFRNEAQLDAVQRDIQVLKECGVDFELLLKDDLAKVEPALAHAKDKLVGDREHDILGARRNGIETIAVEYGYGSDQELTEAAPKARIKTFADILDLI
jgi:D-amino-acid dehydrogenase